MFTLLEMARVGWVAGGTTTIYYVSFERQISPNEFLSRIPQRFRVSDL